MEPKMNPNPLSTRLPAEDLSLQRFKEANTITFEDHIIHKHPIATYFFSTFVISWGAIFAVVGPHGFPSTSKDIEMLLPWVVLAMLAGPSITGVSMIFIIYRWAGFQRLRVGLMPQWHHGLHWWLLALLIAPLTVTTVLVTLSCTDPVYMPVIFTSDDKANRVVTAFIYAFAAGFFEELGWTAFVVHEMGSRHGILATGFLVGIAWGAWHLLVAVWGSASTYEPGAFSATAFLPQILFYTMVLPAYRILMVWIYVRTSCTSAAMVMHASLTASLPLVLAPLATGLDLALAYLVLAVVLWGGITVATSRGAFGSSRKGQKLALRGLLLCGAASTVPYIASAILSAVSRNNNDAGSQPCSVVAALRAATEAEIGPLLVTDKLLMIFFGVGLRIAAQQNLPLRLVAYGALGTGIQEAAARILFSMKSVDTEQIYIDTLHGILTAAESFFKPLSLGAGILIAGPAFGLYTLLTIALFLLQGGVRNADSSTYAIAPAAPWTAIWRSATTLVYLQWVMVLSILQAWNLQREFTDIELKKSQKSN